VWPPLGLYYAGVFEQREQSEMAKLDAFLELADSEARARQVAGQVRDSEGQNQAVDSGA
jgi:Tfp pilus assembly protein FimT